MTKLVSPSQNPVIRKYLKDVLAWHGYIRFLGMPTLQTNPDVPIDELYVAQSLSLENLPTDKEPKPEQLFNPVSLLLDKGHVIVLGDPGSGKSTLINWFAWQLASGFVDRLPKELSELIPVPIVLRELKLENVTNFETLIGAFIDRPLAKAFSGEKDLILRYAEDGKLLLLVDGLDEVSLEFRKILQTIFNEFFIHYNHCFSIFTTRKVGYELAPIGVHYDLAEDEQLRDIATIKDSKLFLKNLLAHSAKVAAINATAESLPYKPVECFVAPFTNRQINQFSLNWYKENTTGNVDGALYLRDEFVISIRSNESTLQLARTPQLLTMMALIFKVRLQLPNGRALLYDLIAQAYLESIDTARKLKDPFIWQDKKKWLARIGFEMQLRRTNKPAVKDSGNELLADKSEILQWLISEMKQTGMELVDKKYAEAYLDWIARRSGLLLPRGEGQFAFLHLSFQEYFSAIYIQQQIENPDYFFADTSEFLDSRFVSKPLEEWVSLASWHQTFIFLFELISTNPGLLKRIWLECFQEKIYGEQRDAVISRLESFGYDVPSQIPQIQLLIDLLANPHVAVNGALIKKNTSELINLSLLEQEAFSTLPSRFIKILAGNDLLSNLLRNKKMADEVFDVYKSADSLSFLCVDNIPEDSLEKLISGFSSVGKLSGVMATNCGLISLKIFSNYNLESLILDGTVANDYKVIEKMTSLRFLSLNGCLVKDLNFVSNLKDIETLELNYNDVSNFSPIENLKKIRSLAVVGNATKDLTTISKLKNLRQLDVSDLESLEPILKLVNLESLSIMSSPKITDVKPLAKLKKLKYLFLSKTGVKKAEKYGLRRNVTIYVS